MSGSVTSQVSAENQRDREIEQVRSMVMSLRERNVRLTRLNMALSIELKDIISERVLLEGNYLVTSIKFIILSVIMHSVSFVKKLCASDLNFSSKR